MDDWTEGQVRIVSGGNQFDTTITVDGKPLLNVTAITWRIDTKSGLATATLEVENVAVELTGLVAVPSDTAG